MSQRIALVLHLDPSWDVEAYQLAGRLTDTPGVRSIEVVPLEDGDELMRMSTAKRAVTAGLESWIETDSIRDAISRAVGHYANAPESIECSSSGPWPADHDAEINRPPIVEISEARRAELGAERRAQRAAQTIAEQAARRIELEELDRRAAEAARERTCAGGCSRGGEGPACGRRGCTG